MPLLITSAILALAFFWLIHEMDKGIQSVSLRDDEPEADSQDIEAETAMALLRAEAQQIILDAAQQRAPNDQ